MYYRNKKVQVVYFNKFVFLIYAPWKPHDTEG